MTTPDPTVLLNPADYSCEDCAAFEPREGGNGVGLCIRHPPQVFLDGDSVYSAFPDVDRKTTFCFDIIRINNGRITEPDGGQGNSGAS